MRESKSTDVHDWSAALENPGSNANSAAARERSDDRLDSWKKIASYLKRDVSTVQRWERRESMPVHRHLHDKLGSVFAFRSELDAWWESRRTRLVQEGGPEAGPPAPILPAAKSIPESPPRRLEPRGVWWTIGAGLVASLLALAWLTVHSSYFWRSPLANARFAPLPEFAGAEGEAAISRDGKLMAFLARRDGIVDAWLSELGSGTYRNLTHGEFPELINPSIRTLGFSADSSLVSIWTRRADGSQPGDINVMAVPASGGPSRLYVQGAAELDWSHDGKRLVYHTTAPGDPLFLAESQAVGKSAERRIYAAGNGVHCHFPVWSSDDAYIYFVRGVPPDEWDIWRIRPSGDALERITAHNGYVSFPVVIDRRTLAYLATDAGGAGPWIYAIDVERKVSHRISYGLESYTSLGASGDGARLVATLAKRRTSLWRMTLANEATNVPASREPSLVLANGATPRLGVDSLLYVSSQGARQGIWSLAQGVATEIWSSAHARVVGGPTLDRSRRRVTFSVEQEGRTRLYVMDDTGAHLKSVAESLALRGNPTWSPDGQSIVVAVVHDAEPRLTRIFVNGDPPLPMVSEYSTDPVWSPDGQFLVYSGADVGTTFPLRAAAADGRPYALPTVMLTRGARRVAFLRDSRTLIVLGGDIDHKDILSLDLRTGDQRVLADLPRDFAIHDFDVSTTGAEIVFDRVEASSELELIERAR